MKLSALYVVCDAPMCIFRPLSRAIYANTKGGFVQPNGESGRYVLCPDRIVLKCRCGGRLILLGHEEDWYSEGRTTFECQECEGELTLADRLEDERGPALIEGSDEEAMSVRDLIRSLRAAEGQ